MNNNGQTKQTNQDTVFYVVQQLNLPSPRVSVINLKIISEQFFSMNSPEFSLKDQNFGPYNGAWLLYL